MMLNPPCMMPGHKHWECCKSEKPPVRCCFLEDKVVIAFMSELKQIDINPRANCPGNKENSPPWLATETNSQSNLGRSKRDTPECCTWCISKKAFDFWMIANHLFCTIAVPDSIRFFRIANSITNVNFIARKHGCRSSKNPWMKSNFFMCWCVGGE